MHRFLKNSVKSALQNLNVDVGNIILKIDGIFHHRQKEAALKVFHLFVKT